MRRLRTWLERRAPVLPVQAAYTQWAAHYPPLPHNRFMALEQATLIEMLPPLTHQTALDLACGSGRWGRIAAQHGAERVISLDANFAMLGAGHPPLATVASINALPLPPESVDVVICGLAIGHISREGFESSLSEIGRVLRPAGIALISDVHPVQMWRGAKRTFWHKGRPYAVEHHIHSYSHYHQAATRLGLTIADVQEVASTPEASPVLLALKLIKAPAQPPAHRSP